MRKFFCLLVAILLIAASVTTAFAANETQKFLFELSCDGESTVEVTPGQVITVTFRLRRTDTSDSYAMYAMQNEIGYDSSFFELVEDSVTLLEDVVSADVPMADHYRELYMNYLSMTGGSSWNADEIIGRFQMRVIAQSGVTTIKNTNFLVSTKDGMDVYASEASDLTVVLTTHCTVTFDSAGGSAVADQLVQFGEKVTRPEDPVREGYAFDGWYRDLYLTEPWDFDTDTVQGNMRLYAKWTQAEISETETTGIAESGAAAGLQQLWWIIPLLLVVVVVVIMKLRKGKQ